MDHAREPIAIVLRTRAEYRAACQVRDATARDLFYMQAEGDASEEVVAVLSRQVEALDLALANYQAQPRWRRLLRWGDGLGALSFGEAMTLFESELDRLRGRRA